MAASCIGQSNDEGVCVRSLDVGCGACKTQGCLGIDRVALPGVDVVHNLDSFPWPLEDDAFTVIYSNHFLEHAGDIVETLREIHRVGAPGAQFYVRVPHYASDNFHSDLTHKTAFGYRSFDHYSSEKKIQYDFYEPFRFRIVRRRLKFMGPAVRFDPFKWLGIEAVVNRFPRIYERFFVYWLPPAEIMFDLEIVK